MGCGCHTGSTYPVHRLSRRSTGAERVFIDPIFLPSPPSSTYVPRYASERHFPTRKNTYWLEQITDVLDNFDNALNNAIVLDNQIFVDGNKISANYSDLLSISTRQVMGAIDFTVGYDSAGNWNTSDVMAFLRNAAGIGSGGCVFFFGSSLYLMLTVSCIYLQNQSEHCGCHLCRLANILVPQSE